jgi:thymidylate synthase
MNVVDLTNPGCRDISDAWFQLLFKILEYGSIHRLEFDYVTVKINYPGTEPLLPQIPEQYGIPNPVGDDYLNEYLPYLMTGEKDEGESYTYGERMCKSPIPLNWLKFYDFENWKNILIQDSIWKNKDIIIRHELVPKVFLNQMELVIWTYKNKGYRNNQMVLQVGEPNDMLLQDPPCLRHIDTRIQNNKLHFFVYFRSWDLWGGFPANLAAIEMLKQYMAAEIGVESGEIIAASKGLHLYDYSFDMAKCLRMRDDMKLEGE